ncbi:hypothetical protein AAZV13_02G200900 [Glycine max]
MALPVGFYVCGKFLYQFFRGEKEKSVCIREERRLMILLSQRKKKQERKTLYSCFSISNLIIICLQQKSLLQKKFPCWEKIKMIFPYLCFFISFGKQCFARFVCVVMRSSIAFLSLTLMKTVTVPILFSLPPSATSLITHLLFSSTDF